MNRRDFLTFHTQRKTVTNAPLARSRRGAKAVRNSDLNSKEQAARFLMQATFGPTMAEIDQAEQLGFEAWIDQQMSLPATNTLQYMWDEVHTVYLVENEPLLDRWPFRWAWWQAVMRGKDLLRQRVAMALSEIMVVSTKTDVLLDVSPAMGSYYDTLLKHSFGSFRDLLYDVSIHPAMGYYLSHAGNRKADPSINRYPDENYAREVMQLFSIGLFELNQDGSRKKDSNGNDIPTYNNDDIKEFAKIFTGLTYRTAEFWEDEDMHTDTGEAFSLVEMNYQNGQYPMEMHDQYHSPGKKYLLNGQVVPAGQTGLKDVSDAVDNLFNHQNVGPFIGRLLIQRLVKSNPSPQYVSRVAAAFNDNGRAERGDLGAVVKAILLDDEARNTSYINDPYHGMLREPFFRYVHLCRALELRNQDGEERFFNFAVEAQEEIGQHGFASPSVFNFFSPDYQPLGSIGEAGLVAPEFQITTSVTTIRLFNFLHDAIMFDELMEVPHEPEAAEEEGVQRFPVYSHVIINMEPYRALDGDFDRLIDRLNLLLMYGTMSDTTRNIITTAVRNATQGEEELEWEEACRFAIALVATCPECAVMK